MADPEFIAQTFDPEHTESDDAAWDWWQAQADKAWDGGCTFPRYTRDHFKLNEQLPDGTMGKAKMTEGLLFEAWIVRPEDQGKPRWAVTSP